jgi:cytochrome b involved in lipid metabolism
MKTHSGGPDVMTPFCGKDGTSAYQGGSTAHSGAAIIGTKLILKGAYTGGSPNNNNGGKISLATIATHATATDCWVMISGIAYDMTEYMSSHAGGTGPIIALCGQDATTGYVTQRGHSATRLARMVSVKNLGVVDGYNSDGSIATSNSSNFFTDNPIAAICIFVAVGGIALLVVLHFVTSYYHRRRLRLDAAIGGKMQKENMV